MSHVSPVTLRCFRIAKIVQTESRDASLLASYTEVQPILCKDSIFLNGKQVFSCFSVLLLTIIIENLVLSIFFLKSSSLILSPQCHDTFHIDNFHFLRMTYKLMQTFHNPLFPFQNTKNKKSFLHHDKNYTCHLVQH